MNGNGDYSMKNLLNFDACYKCLTGVAGLNEILMR